MKKKFDYKDHQTINVPVGDVVPTKDVYNGYNIYKVSVNVENDVDILIDRLKELKKEYSNEYTGLTIQSSNDCGCRYDCSCSPTFYLYGMRKETDLEYNYRVKQHEDREAEKLERDKKEFQRLMVQFGDERKLPRI